MTPARTTAATVIAAFALLLAGCTSPDNTTAESAPSRTPALSTTPTVPTPSSSASTSASSTPTKASSTPPEPTPTAPAADVRIAVVVKAGKVTPNGDNVRVKDGQAVQITLDSDVAESIHVHGYDKTVEVQPGDSDDVTFTADQKGVFEVETHETAKLVVKLIVS